MRIIERIEPRLLMAGNVVVHVANDQLLISGDSLSNSIILSQSDNELVIGGVSGTTIDGQAEQRYPGRSRYVLNLGKGDDSVTASGELSALLINAGNGNDTLFVSNGTVAGDLYFCGRAGNDKVWLANTVVKHNVNLAGGDGIDRVFTDVLSVGRDFVVGDANGASALSLDALSVHGGTAVLTGNSIDRLNINNSTFAGHANVQLRGGDDQVVVRGSVFKTASPFDVGLGNNHVDRELILSWDFNDGSQGWGADLSDIGADAKTDPSVGYLAGVKSLPADLNTARAAYYLQFKNISDDVFAFIAKKLTSQDGLLAGQGYSIRFNVKIASDQPTGALGVGGSPSDSVYLKMGAVPGNPLISRRATETQAAVYSVAKGAQVLLALKGAQANSGKELSVGGTAANGRPSNSAEQGFASTTYVHTHRHTLTANTAGELSLITGFDSGFEGISRLYILSIRVSMTPV